LGGYDRFVAEGSPSSPVAPGSLRAGSVVPLAPVGRPAVAGSWRAVALAVPVFLVVSVLVAVAVREYATQRVAAAGRFDPDFTGRRAIPEASPESTPGGNPEASPSATPGASPSSPSRAPGPPPVAPPGYQVQHEAAGYWLATPKGWEVRSPDDGGREWWGDLSRSDVKLLFVTVKAATTKPQTAKAALTYWENAQQHSGTIFYHRIQLADKPRPAGAASVADLEFTDRDYAQGAQTWHFHTLVRAVVTPDNRLYTIQFMILHDIYQDKGTTEGDWQRAAPTVGKILASFRLG
jgi:hypothetical protein